MNTQFAFEVAQARHRRMVEQDNRERLADIARAGHAKRNRTATIITLFRRIVQRGVTPWKQAFRVSRVARPAEARQPM